MWGVTKRQFVSPSSDRSSLLPVGSNGIEGRDIQTRPSFYVDSPRLVVQPRGELPRTPLLGREYGSSLA